MGFMDKVKSQAEQIAKQGQDKLDDMQAKKAAEGLLRDLGAWYYAVQTGRDNGQGAAELARITAELQSHEAEHGPLGGGGEAEGAEAAPAPPAGAPAVLFFLFPKTNSSRSPSCFEPLNKYQRQNTTAPTVINMSATLKTANRTNSNSKKSET